MKNYNLSVSAYWNQTVKNDESRKNRAFVRSVVDQKLDKIYDKQITVEITSIVSQYVRVLGLSNDSHFAANKKNIELLNNNILKTRKLVEDIQIPENITINDIISLLTEDKMIGVGFYKMKKSSLIMFLLGILIFILTTF